MIKEQFQIQLVESIVLIRHSHVESHTFIDKSTVGRPLSNKVKGDVTLINLSEYHPIYGGR